MANSYHQEPCAPFERVQGKRQRGNNHCGIDRDSGNYDTDSKLTTLNLIIMKIMVMSMMSKLSLHQVVLTVVMNTEPVLSERDNSKIKMDKFEVGG